MQTMYAAMQDAKTARKQEKADARTAALQQNANDLQRDQLQFQREQAQWQRKEEREAAKLAKRPDPTTVNPAPVMPTVATGGTVGDTGVQEEAASEVDSRRRGRRGLRIDLGAPQVSGGTGLNVPIG